jgi:hypothetical protein
MTNHELIASARDYITNPHRSGADTDELIEKLVNALNRALAQRDEMVRLLKPLLEALE